MYIPLVYSVSMYKHVVYSIRMFKILVHSIICMCRPLLYGLVGHFLNNAKRVREADHLDHLDQPGLDNRPTTTPTHTGQWSLITTDEEH